MPSRQKSEPGKSLDLVDGFSLRSVWYPWSSRDVCVTRNECKSFDSKPKRARPDWVDSILPFSYRTVSSVIFYGTTTHVLRSSFFVRDWTYVLWVFFFFLRTLITTGCSNHAIGTFVLLYLSSPLEKLRRDENRVCRTTTTTKKKKYNKNLYKTLTRRLNDKNTDCRALLTTTKA